MQKVNKHELKVSWEVTSWQKAREKDVAADCSHFLFFKINNMEEVLRMGMTCPIKGCHSTEWCKHKTMMAVMMLIIVIAVAVYFTR